MIKTLRVMLWENEVGRLVWDERRNLSYFTYNPEFLKKGIDISPITAPIKSASAMFHYGERNPEYTRNYRPFLQIHYRMPGEISYLNFGAAKITSLMQKLHP